MTFEEIFNQDGMYTAPGFAEGYAFEINNECLLGIQYNNKNDILPARENIPVYKGLFKKKYKKVLTRQELFLKQTDDTYNAETRTFEEAIEEWENSFSCGDCGLEEGKEGYVYQRTVANGECYDCPECGSEVLVDHEPKEEDF